MTKPAHSEPEDETERDRDERYRDPHPEDGRVIRIGSMYSTKKNEAW